MYDHTHVQYARQRADEMKLVDRPERRMEREARLSRRPGRWWRAW